MNGMYSWTTLCVMQWHERKGHHWLLHGHGIDIVITERSTDIYMYCRTSTAGATLLTWIDVYPCMDK